MTTCKIDCQFFALVTVCNARRVSLSHKHCSDTTRQNNNTGRGDVAVFALAPGSLLWVFVSAVALSDGTVRSASYLHARSHLGQAPKAVTNSADSGLLHSPQYALAPLQELSNCTALSELHAEHNCLSLLPIQLSALTNLKTLGLDNNRYKMHKSVKLKVLALQ